MHWTKPGAQAVLDPRGVRLSGDGDADWPWHRRPEHDRLDGAAAALSPPIEDLALTPAAAA